MTDEKIQQLNEFRILYDRMKPEFQKALKHINNHVKGELDKAGRMEPAGTPQSNDKQTPSKRYRS